MVFFRLDSHLGCSPSGKLGPDLENKGQKVSEMRTRRGEISWVQCPGSKLVPESSQSWKDVGLMSL